MSKIGTNGRFFAQMVRVQLPKYLITYVEFCKTIVIELIHDSC